MLVYLLLAVLARCSFMLFAGLMTLASVAVGARQESTASAPCPLSSVN